MLLIITTTQYLFKRSLWHRWKIPIKIWAIWSHQNIQIWNSLDSCQRIGNWSWGYYFPSKWEMEWLTGVSREMQGKTYKIEDVAKSHGANRIKLWKPELWWLLLFDVMHVGVKGWMEVEKNFTNLQTKLTNTHRLILWTLFFYIWSSWASWFTVLWPIFRIFKNLSIVNFRDCIQKGPGARATGLQGFIFIGYQLFFDPRKLPKPLRPNQGT